ncbi:hypothetical protein [Micromonospora nigra]|nr:hypothetical protein [Micromonospora nigra]
MSDAHLTERQLPGRAEPVDLTDEPFQLSHPGSAEPSTRRAGGSRRRRAILAALAALGLLGAGALGSAGWRIAQQKDADIATPDRVAGLVRDDSERARNTADYLRSGFAADIELDRSFGTVYRDPADERRSVLIFGGTTLLWQPERDLDSLFGLMTETPGEVTGLREVPAGRLGGFVKCGTTSGEGGDFAVCGWADHGSVVMAMFPGRSVDDSARLLREIRETVQTRR